MPDMQDAVNNESSREGASPQGATPAQLSQIQAIVDDTYEKYKNGDIF